MERNRVKRLLREAFAAESARLPAGMDVVVIARPSVLRIAEASGVRGVRDALGALIGAVDGASDTACEPDTAETAAT